jgi:hypothetical protein
LDESAIRSEINRESSKTVIETHLPVAGRIARGLLSDLIRLKSMTTTSRIFFPMKRGSPGLLLIKPGSIPCINKNLMGLKQLASVLQDDLVPMMDLEIHVRIAPEIALRSKLPLH